ncbi:MAG: carbon-nitrogen hydrolase family protein [Spirochaetes bacterium]|nr:carbon-nitrogen hydrolase family protein [Spirochaetota bacterium]
MYSFRIILFQHSLGERVSKAQIDEMADFKPHFVCFPEYYFTNKKLGNHKQTIENQKRQIRYIQLLSKRLRTVIIGGSMPELENNLLYNTCFVFKNGELLGYYRKRNLFFAEIGKITPGNEWKTFSAYGITFGVLICADVFSDESFLEMKKFGAKIIFIPTFSLRKVETIEEKHRRDREIFVRGASLANAIVVKVCSVPSPYKDFIHGRSLIASPNDIIYRVKPEEEEKSLIIKQVICIS